MTQFLNNVLGIKTSIYLLGTHNSTCNTCYISFSQDFCTCCSHHTKHSSLPCLLSWLLFILHSQLKWHFPGEDFPGTNYKPTSSIIYYVLLYTSIYHKSFIHKNYLIYTFTYYLLFFKTRIHRFSGLGCPLY